MKSETIVTVEYRLVLDEQEATALRKLIGRQTPTMFEAAGLTEDESEIIFEIHTRLNEPLIEKDEDDK